MSKVAAKAFDNKAKADSADKLRLSQEKDARQLGAPEVALDYEGNVVSSSRGIPLVTPGNKEGENIHYDNTTDLINETGSGIMEKTQDENIGNKEKNSASDDVEGGDDDSSTSSSSQEDEDEESLLSQSEIAFADLEKAVNEANQKAADAQAQLDRMAAEHEISAAKARADLEKLREETIKAAEKLEGSLEAEKQRKRKREARLSEIAANANNTGLTPTLQVKPLTFRQGERHFMTAEHVNNTARPPMDRGQVLEFEKKMLHFQQTWPSVPHDFRQYFTVEAEVWIETYLMSKLRLGDIFKQPWPDLVSVLKQMYPESESSREKAHAEAFHEAVRWMKDSMFSAKKWFQYQEDEKLVTQTTFMLTKMREIMSSHDIPRDDIPDLMKGKWGYDVVFQFMKVLKNQNNTWDKKLSAMLEDRKQTVNSPEAVHLMWLAFHVGKYMEEFHEIRNSYEENKPPGAEVQMKRGPLNRSLAEVNAMAIETAKNADPFTPGFNPTAAMVATIWEPGQNNRRGRSRDRNRGYGQSSGSHYSGNNKSRKSGNNDRRHSNNGWGVPEWEDHGPGRNRDPSRSRSRDRVQKGRAPSPYPDRNRREQSQSPSRYSNPNSPRYGLPNMENTRRMSSGERNNKYSHPEWRDKQEGKKKIRPPICQACGKSHPGGPSDCMFVTYRHPDVNLDRNCPWEHSATYRKLQSISNRCVSLEYKKNSRRSPKASGGL